jgi:hypothetical protein
MIRLLILFSFIANISLGQDTIKKKTKEYYLSIADFSPLNIHIKYKKQIGKKTFFKIGLINLSGNFNKQQPANTSVFPTSTSNLTAGLQIGLEFRKQLNEKFTFFHGLNLNYSYGISTLYILNPAIPQREQKSSYDTHTASIPYTLGLIFNMSKHVLISAEINPSVNFSRSSGSNSFNSNLKNINTAVNFGFDNRYGLLSIVYRL